MGQILSYGLDQSLRALILPNPSLPDACDVARIVILSCLPDSPWVQKFGNSGSAISTATAAKFLDPCNTLQLKWHSSASWIWPTGWGLSIPDSNNSSFSAQLFP